ncbi:MAG: hypothetical protein RR316_06340, partial [Clostridia bacterium]
DIMKNGIENNIKNYKIKNIVRFCITILLFVILISHLIKQYKNSKIYKKDISYCYALFTA